MNIQEKINYIDVINLGFKEEFIDDKVYFNTYGYGYCLITKKLTTNIYIDWAKETRLCEIVRYNPKTGFIYARMPINNLEHLKEIIEFFTKTK